MLISVYRDTASHYGLCEDDGICDNELVIDVAKEPSLCHIPVSCVIIFTVKQLTMQKTNRICEGKLWIL